MMKAKRGRRRKSAPNETPEPKVKGGRSTSQRRKEFFNTLRLSPVPVQNSLPKKRGRPPKNKNMLRGKLGQKIQKVRFRKKYVRFNKSANDTDALEKMHLEICAAIEKKEKLSLVKNIETNSDQQVIEKNPVFEPKPVQIETKDEVAEGSNPRKSEVEPVLEKTKIFTDPKINWKVFVQLEKLTENNVYYKNFLERNLEKNENLYLSEEEERLKKKKRSESFDKPDTKERASGLEYSRKLRLEKFVARPSRRKLPDPELLIINSKHEIFKNAVLGPGIDPNYNFENLSNLSTPVSTKAGPCTKNIETSPHVRCSIKLSNHQEIAKIVIPNCEKTKNATSETKTSDSKPRAIRLRRENSSISSTKSSENAFLDENSNAPNISKTVKKRIVFDLDNPQKGHTNSRIRTISRSSTASSVNEDKQLSPFVTPEKNDKNQENQIELRQESIVPHTSTPLNVIGTEIYDIPQEKVSINIIDFDQDENSQEASRISSSGSQKSGSENSETSRKVRHILRFDGMPLKVPPSKRKNLSLIERLGDKLIDARLIIEKNRSLNAGKNNLGQKESSITDFKMPSIPKEKQATKLSMMPNLQTQYSPLNSSPASKDYDDSISIYADSTIFEIPESRSNSQQQYINFSNLRIQNWIDRTQENILDPNNSIETSLFNDPETPTDLFQTEIFEGPNETNRRRNEIGPNEPFLGSCNLGPNTRESNLESLVPNASQGSMRFTEANLGSLGPNASQMGLTETNLGSSGPNTSQMRFTKANLGSLGPNASQRGFAEANLGSLGPNASQMRFTEANLGSLGPSDATRPKEPISGPFRPNQSKIRPNESNLGSLEPSDATRPKESISGPLRPIQSKIRPNESNLGSLGPNTEMRPNEPISGPFGPNGGKKTPNETISGLLGPNASQMRFTEANLGSLGPSDATKPNEPISGPFRPNQNKIRPNESNLGSLGPSDAMRPNEPISGPFRPNQSKIRSNESNLRSLGPSDAMRPNEPISGPFGPNEAISGTFGPNCAKKTPNEAISGPLGSNDGEIRPNEPFGKTRHNEPMLGPFGPNSGKKTPNEAISGTFGPNGGKKTPNEAISGTFGPNGGKKTPNEAISGTLRPNNGETIPKEPFSGSSGSSSQNSYGRDLNNIYRNLCIAFRNNGVCYKYSCKWLHSLPQNFDKQIFEYDVEDILKFYDQIKNKTTEIYLWKILFPLVLKRLRKDQRLFERLLSLINDVMEKNFDDDKTQFILMIINAYDEFGLSINTSIDIIFKITKFKSLDLKDTLGDILLQILTERMKDLKGSWDTIKTLTKNRSNIDNGSIESILSLALTDPIEKSNIINLYEDILVSLENRQLNLISEHLFSKYVDCLKNFNYKNEASTLFYRRKGDEKKRWTESNLPSEISSGAFESSDELFSSRSSDSCSISAKDTYKQNWNLGSSTGFGSNLGSRTSNLGSNGPNSENRNMNFENRTNLGLNSHSATNLRSKTSTLNSNLSNLGPNGPNFENRNTNLQNRMNSENRTNLGLGLNSNSTTNLGSRVSNLGSNGPNSENRNLGFENCTNPQNRMNRTENCTNLGLSSSASNLGSLEPRSSNLRNNLSNLGPNGPNSGNYNLGPENRTNLQNRTEPENCTDLETEFSSNSGPRSMNLRPNLGSNGPNPENHMNLGSETSSRSNLPNMGPISPNLRTGLTNLGTNGPNFEKRNIGFENRENRTNPENCTNLQTKMNSGSNFGSGNCNWGYENRITPEKCRNQENPSNFENLEDRRKLLGPQNRNTNFEPSMHDNRTYNSNFSVKVENFHAYNNCNYRIPPSMPPMGPRPGFHPRGMLNQNQRGFGRGFNQNRRRYENRNFDNYSNNWNKNYNGENLHQNSEPRPELYKIKPPETVVANNSEENSVDSENDHFFPTADSNQNNPKSPSLTDSQPISEENRSPILTEPKMGENDQTVQENNDLNSFDDVREKMNNLDFTSIKKSYDLENTLEILQGILNMNDNLKMDYIKFVLNFLVGKKNTPIFYNTICDAYIVCHNTKAEGVLKCLGINLLAYFVHKNELSNAFKLFKTITSYFGKNGLELEEVFLDGKKLSISRKVLIICQILIHNKEFGTVWNNLTKWSNFLCKRSEWKFPSEESDVEYRDAVFDSFMEALCLSQNKYTLKYLTEIVKIQNCDIDITSYINDCINVALNDKNLDHTELETLERFYPNWSQEADPLIFRAVNVILFNKKSVDWLKIFDKGKDLGIYPQVYGDEPHLELERNLTPEEVYMILKSSLTKRQEKNILSPLKISIKNHFIQSEKYLSIPTLPPPVSQKDMIFRIANVCRQKLYILFDIDLTETNSITFKTDHLKNYYEKMV